MNRGFVYNIVLIERGYQDAKWGDIEQSPHTIEEWLQIMQDELDEARTAFEGGDEAAAMQEISQVAAVAFAAMEQHGVAPRRGLPDSDRFIRFLNSFKVEKDEQPDE